MPITINEIETHVQVDSRGSSNTEHSNEQSHTQQANWQDLMRRENQRETRTSAWNFED